eukprot:942858_1
MALFQNAIRRFSSGRIYKNILETIGNTPVVQINKLAPSNVDLYVKCEFFNPLGSIKDRMGMGIIEDAEQRGLISPGDTVIEATSGNAGIGLALVCAAKGYPFVAVMADFYSIERRKIMRALGAKVVLTPSKFAGAGMTHKARELAQRHGWFLASQFENPANTEYHANTTAPEILTTFRTNSKPLDYFVTGYGSGGTFAGTGRTLKAALPDIKIILSEPTTAPLIQSGIKQERNPPSKEEMFSGSPSKVHDAWKPHVIAGWAPSFIPKLAEDGLDLGLADEVISIDPNESMQAALNLAQQEGIFTGISGGATFASALKVCEKAKDGSGILAILPDTMERYLSTELFDNIEEFMSEEEITISNSTPNYHMELNVK